MRESDKNPSAVSKIFSLTHGYVHSKILELDKHILQLRKFKALQDEKIKILRAILRDL